MMVRTSSKSVTGSERRAGEHLKTTTSEAEKPGSTQQKSMIIASEALTGSARMKTCRQNSDACVETACAAVQEGKTDGTREVLPRTATTLVVLEASTDHAVVESRRREDRTAFSERQWWTEDSREAHNVESRCAQDAYSRVWPAGGDSRDVRSTARMSAEVRLPKRKDAVRALGRPWSTRT